ncbi:MAG: hypothetical protein IJX17_02980 [Clostridia bacterium]|nr:hypothetical protein [Clostridia bacterium]
MLIMLTSFYLGQNYKNRIIKQYKFFNYLKRFTNYLKANINLFKINIINIIDEFKINNDEKNANYSEIFIKNGEIYDISRENIEKIGLTSDDNIIIYNYLKALGTNEYYYEENKNNSFITYLDRKLEEYSNYIKTKGELTLKIALAIGCVISIIIW